MFSRKPFGLSSGDGCLIGNTRKQYKYGKEIDDDEAGQRAIDNLNGREVERRPLRVNAARPRAEE